VCDSAIYPHLILCVRSVFTISLGYHRKYLVCLVQV
jgi:hypothetical protein